MDAADPDSPERPRPRHEITSEATPSARATAVALQRLIAASDRFRQAGAATLGLTITDTDALGSLHLSGPITQTDLAARVGITRGSCTTVIDRLQAAGLVERAPHPTDRRITLVDLTDQGREQLRRSALRLTSTVPDLAESEAHRLAELLEVITAQLDLAAVELLEVRADPRS